jgi:NitT/TauT family transport system ATP-binding protein|tara:strand:- start:547 stop:1401 length:855 start_codon:yes stop_codon:yes gene_type:complete
MKASVTGVETVFPDSEGTGQNGPEQVRISMELRGLGKKFLVGTGEFQALQSIDLDVGVGEFVCFLGASGCGKTTLLRILGGLEKHTEGSLRFYQEKSGQPPTSIVFQEVSIFPWLTVWDNVAFGLRARHAPKALIKERVSFYIEKVGLTPFRDHYPHQLSGGMKQRVSIARAFANDPEVLLLDEPFSALDERNKATLQDELLRIWEETGKTIVFVTHSIDEAIYLADRILVFAGPPGHITQIHRPDFVRPRNLTALRATPEYKRLVGSILEGLGISGEPSDAIE